MPSQSLRPLSVAGFGRLLASYVINAVGDAIAIVALTILVFDATGDALATAALFVAAKFLPALVAPAVTARVDQASLRRTLPAIYTAEALVFVALALQASDPLLVATLLLALLDGVLALTARGLTRGAVAGLLGPSGLLRDGNALINIAFGLSAVVGLAAGGVLAGGPGVKTALLINAGSFLFAALLLVSSGALEEPPAERQPFLERLREGLRHVGDTPGLRALMLWQATALLFFTLIVPIEVIYAKETLGTGDAGYGALLGCWAAGVLVGSLLFLRLKRAAATTVILASTAAVGVAYVGMAAVDDLGPACAFAVLGGLGNGNQWVSVMTYLQEATPPDLQARMAGLLESIGAAVPGLGFVLGGALTALTSAPTTFLAAGFGVIALVLGGLLRRRRLAEATPRLQPAAPSDGA